MQSRTDRQANTAGHSVALRFPGLLHCIGSTPAGAAAAATPAAAAAPAGIDGATGWGEGGRGRRCCRCRGASPRLLPCRLKLLIDSYMRRARLECTWPCRCPAAAAAAAPDDAGNGVGGERSASNPVALPPIDAAGGKPARADAAPSAHGIAAVAAALWEGTPGRLGHQPQQVLGLCQPADAGS